MKTAPRSRTVAPSESLRQIIERRNLTAYRVAQLADVAPSVVSRFMSGERGLSIESFDAVCQALGVELRETRRRRRA